VNPWSEAELKKYELKLREWRHLIEKQARDPGPECPPAARDTRKLNEAVLEVLWRKTSAAQLREIDLALERLETGVFGLCERCSQPIPHERLDATPWVRRCFPCQSRPAAENSGAPGHSIRPLRWYSPFE